MGDKVVSVRLYSAEKNKRTGNGSFTVKCKECEVEQTRADQKTKNQQFKELILREKKAGATSVITKAIEKMSIAMPEHIEYNPGSTELPSLQSKDESSLQSSLQSKQYTVISKHDQMPELTEFKLVLDEGTGNTTFLLGSSKQGKTTLLMKIFDDYYSDKDNVATLFSINSHIKLYGKRKRMLRFPTDYECSAAQIAKYIKVEKRINSNTKNHYSFVNLFDDLIDVRYSKVLHNSILTYRNSNISTVICLQYNNLLAKQARSNVNNVILFGLNTDEAIKQAVDTYLKAKFKQMGIAMCDHIEYYKKLTSDHQFIYYRPSDNIITFHKLTI